MNQKLTPFNSSLITHHSSLITSLKRMNLVFIYGPPGVGKLSAARELARLTGYKLFDNHVSIRCADSVFDFGTKPFWKIVGSIRDMVFEEAAANGVSLVTTFVYSHPQDLPGIECRCASFE